MAQTNNRKDRNPPTQEPSRKVSTTREQREERRKNRGGGASADWSGINHDVIAHVISAITSLGFAVQFGYTRDGGAYAIRVVGDGEPYNEYIRASEDVELYLNGLADDYT